VTAALGGLLTLGVLSGCLSADQTTVQKQINSARSSRGIRTLIDYTKADNKAQLWANKLAADGRLSHSELTGAYTPGTWCHLGENVGMGPSLSSIQNGFMNSPPHAANILNGVYDHVGTGVVKKGSTYYVVQEFVDLC
jgi:uncharacterized protein YkwD